ncbi:MAG: 50S ribosomal protein L31 [Candidatus Chromulinivorax sp.]
MKPGIHPEVFSVDVHCTCGATYKMKSTMPDITSTLCSHCHPFFTGQQKFVDAAGRIDKFNKKYNSQK